MDDEVRRLLTDFADRTVGEGRDTGAHADLDIDADVARGRRALRRLRLRRRTAGVLAVATAAGAVALTGGPAAWFSGNGDQVATNTPAASPTSRTPAPSTPAPPPAQYSVASSIVLAKGAKQWGGIGCGLSPAGWQYQKNDSGYAVLAPPYSSNSDARDLNGKLVLHTALNADKILKVDAVRQPGRIVHLGWYPAGERVAQTKLGDTWLIVRTPRGAAGWDDQVLLRFVGSCSVTAVTIKTPPAR